MTFLWLRFAFKNTAIHVLAMCYGLCYTMTSKNLHPYVKMAGFCELKKILAV